MISKILYAIGITLFCVTLYGKQTPQVEILPADVQAHIDSIDTHSKSNDWASVRKEYDKIDWRNIKQPAKVLAKLSKKMKGNKDAKALRTEIKTKYELLREDGDADMDDKIASTPIPVVQLVVQRFPAILFGQLELVVIDVPSLQYTDQINIGQYVNCVVIISTRDDKFINAMELWTKRYGKQIDYWDDKGNKIIPMPGSILGIERQALIKAVEAGGDYDKLWNIYNEHLAKAVGRRINLKKKR